MSNGESQSEIDRVVEFLILRETLGDDAPEVAAMLNESPFLLQQLREHLVIDGIVADVAGLGTGNAPPPDRRSIRSDSSNPSVPPNSV